MTPRMEQLREAALQPHICRDHFNLLFYRRLAGLEGDLQTKIAGAFLYAFDNVRLTISPDEEILGRASETLTREEEAEWTALQQGVYREYATPMAQDSHMSPDYELLLREGMEGVGKRITALLPTADEEARHFYNACLTAMEGAVHLSRRYAQAAEALAAEAETPEDRQRLLEAVACCRWVPEHPARTFREAVQSVHFLAFCLSYYPLRGIGSTLQYQLGHPDRYLLPYYEADIAAGRLTDSRARELMDSLAIQINHRLPNGLSGGYMVGGRDAGGNIVCNPLTWMGIQVIDDLRLVFPAVGLCWTEGMPEELLDFACKVLSHGCSHPAIFNDDIISQGLQVYGLTPEEAHDYIHSNCVEITPTASSNVWVASPYTNMPQLLLDTLEEDFDTFDSLLTALLSRLDIHIRRNFLEQNDYRKYRSVHGAYPLLSCFVKDCIGRGRDIERGGARYNWIMPSFVGVANLTDSLYAVKEAVFTEKRYALQQLREMLAANFAGFEGERQRLLSRYPKYGNDDDRVDGLFRLLVDHLTAECRKYTPIFPNGRLIPSVFCWIMHESFGRNTGATPDGRLAGFPLGDGSGPCQGRELQGPTASLLSSTKWSHKELIGGVAVNMKFSKRYFSDATRAKIRSLIHTYLDRGGFELQINVVDNETLLEAQRHPELYRDLVVRIGGYSDYFTRLSPNMQAEVILRTAHAL